MGNNFELRMYGMVPYNLSPIQQGIQFGHAVVEYGQLVSKNKINGDLYNEWADKHKTFIILNGGTTNNNVEKIGTLNQHFETLKKMGVTVVPFHEPDLGDQLTAIVFIVDERVFNKKLYPDLLSEENTKNEDEWFENIGGTKNAILRDFLSGFKLA